MPPGRIPEPREWLLQKTCTKCGETKPWAKFSPAAYLPDGSVRCVQAWCTNCQGSKRAWKSQVDRRSYKRAWSAERRRELQKDAANNSMRLPAHPFKVLLWQQVMDAEEPSWLDLAETCGVPDRSIRRVLAQENVSLSFADKVCTRLGVSIYDLWPHLAEEKAA